MFFSPRAPIMSKHNKNVHTSCAPQYPQSHEISYIFIFFSIFLNLLFTYVQNLCFPLPRAPGVSNQHKNVHAPCGHDYLRPHQISYFFDFFAIFSGRSKTFDRTVTAEKGISISETNGGGAKLSIPKN